MTNVAKDITEIKTDVKWIKESFRQHLTEHFRVRLMATGAAIAAVVAVVLALL